MKERKKRTHTQLSHTVSIEQSQTFGFQVKKSITWQ